MFKSVLQIGTYYRKGGAARAMQRLHRGLIECGHASQIVSRERPATDSIICIKPLDTERDRKEHFLSSVIQRFYIDSSRTALSNTLFTFYQPGLDLTCLEIAHSADIIHLHWIIDEMTPQMVKQLTSLKKPIVWTLHDQWAFTGGCHYSAGCMEYCSNCESCPQLDRDPLKITETLLKDKKELFDNPLLTIVTPSQWMADCAAKSTVFRNHRIEVIPNGIETSVFSPMPKAYAKKMIGINERSKTILFCAFAGDEKRKGFSDFTAAIGYAMSNFEFRRKVEKSELELLFLGGSEQTFDQTELPVKNLGLFDSDAEITMAYAAADLFVLPSLEDNFPNTMLEAMSCGTPLIAYSTGGIPEAITDGDNGLIVPTGDYRKLGDAICSLMENEELLKHMGRRAREKALREFTIDTQATRHSHLYETLLRDKSKLPKKSSPIHKRAAQFGNIAHNGNVHTAIATSIGPRSDLIFDAVLLNSLNALDCSRNDLIKESLEKEFEIRNLKGAADERLQLLTENSGKYEKERESLLLALAEQKTRTNKLEQQAGSLLKEVKINELKIQNLKEVADERLGSYEKERESLMQIAGERHAHIETLAQQNEDLRSKRISFASLTRKTKKKFQNWHKYNYFKTFLDPRLGILEQYPPRKLKIPKKYLRTKWRTQYPSISIVTPSLNQGVFIERTIESILMQNYQHLDYHIVDGGSKDATLNILGSLDKPSISWCSEKDSGQANAINKGFRKTKGDIMAYINSDDMLLPGSLHYVAGFFFKNPKIDVVYGHRIIIDENDFEIGRWVMPRHDNEVLKWVDFIPQETLFWRRRIWEKAGGCIDEKYDFAMDWELILRFRKAGAKFRRVPRFLGEFRRHSQQKTSKEIEKQGEIEMQQLRKRSIGYQTDYEEINKNIRSYMNAHKLLTKLHRVGILSY
ncbi:MAG: glycosyltransferase [Deltaproteobacteria bacterium]|nr:glycosyltransferase [Deltaproteobacteria bacterium]